jgi:PAS domain S-box-containing protein
VRAPLADIALDAFGELDLGWHVIDWNVEAERMFGWPRAEMLGRSASELIPSRNRSIFEEGLRTPWTSAGTGSRRRPISVVHRDGHEFKVDIAATCGSSR